MSATSRNSFDCHKSRISDSQHSLRRMEYEEFNDQRHKILKNSSNLHSNEEIDERFEDSDYKYHKNFSFIGNNDRERGNSAENNTANKRNMVLEIRMKEKEENLLKMTQNQENLIKEIDFYRQKFEEIQESHEMIIGEYEEKLEAFNGMLEDYKEKEKQYMKENSNLKKLNQELIENQANNNNLMNNRPRSRANSIHKFDMNNNNNNSSKRCSFENNREFEEFDKNKKEVEKTKLLMENVYRDNERLINLVKELERFKKECEGLQISNEFLQKEIEGKIEQNEKLKEMIEDFKAGNEEIKQENERKANENHRLLKENEKVLRENDRISKENERILKESDRILKENERVLKESERVLKENNKILLENERISRENDANKRKEQQMQANFLTQLQEMQANSQVQAKTKLKKFENTIEELKKENKALRSTSKTPERTFNNKENEPNINNKGLQIKETMDTLMSLLEAKNIENLVNKITEMMSFQKNTHKLLNSIADLMKSIVPNMSRPSLKEMWSFLKFTIKNYQEIKGKYEEELGVYTKIKHMLNADLTEEVLYNLNSMIAEKKVFLQIISKIKRVMEFKEELSINEINMELNKWGNK